MSLSHYATGLVRVPEVQTQGLCLAPRTVAAALAVALFTGILPGIDVRLVSLGRASADATLLRSRRRRRPLRNGAVDRHTADRSVSLHAPRRLAGQGVAPALRRGSIRKVGGYLFKKEGGRIPTCMVDRGRLSGEQLRADCFCVAGPGLCSLVVCQPPNRPEQIGNAVPSRH